MSNNGDTRLLVNCRPDFSIKDENGNYIDLLLKNHLSSCEAIFAFDPLSKTTFVWSQLDYKSEQVKPGTYMVYSQYMKPFVDESNILSHKGITQTFNFTITS